MIDKDTIEDIDNIQHKLKLADMSNVSFIIYKCNKKLIVQCADFLVQSAIPKISLQLNSDLSYESFHCGIKCTVNKLFTNRIYAFSKLSHIRKASQ